MIRATLKTLTLLLGLLAHPCAAQGDSLHTTLSRGKDGLLHVGSVKFTRGDTVRIPKNGADWFITCEVPVDCSRLRINVLDSSGKSLPLVNPTDRRPTQTRYVPYLTLTHAPTKLILVVSSEGAGDSLVANVAWREAADPSPPAVYAGVGRCANDIHLRAPASSRDHSWTPTFVIDALGNVLYRPTWPIDDRDKIQVRLIGPVENLSQFRVARSSDMRSVGTFNVGGAGVEIPGLLRQNATGGASLGCRSFDLADFSSGKAVVSISAVNAKGETTALGSFDFAVEPTFTGALSIGAIRTKLLDPTIGLAFNGTDSVITATTDGVEGTDKNPYRVLYGVFYTHYLWGRRNLEEPRPLRERFNPMIGLILNDVPNNFVAGGTLDLADGILLTFGAHAGRVRGVDPRSGFAFGDTFSGKAEDIPIVRRWRTEFFFGAALDLRAASHLFKAALGS